MKKLDEGTRHGLVAAIMAICWAFAGGVIAHELPLVILPIMVFVWTIVGMAVMASFFHKMASL